MASSSIDRTADGGKVVESKSTTIEIDPNQPQPVEELHFDDVELDDPSFLPTRTFAIAEENSYTPDFTFPAKVDRYILHGELARGGMGVIYKGVDPLLRREIAMKALLPGHAHNVEFLRRFRIEANVTARLEHPGIVPVYEIGLLPDERPFFTMRVIPGRTLAAEIKATPCRVNARAHLLNLFETICQTVAFAHNRGVLHRDLKPSNIMVGPYGVVKVLDWGLAKFLPNSPLLDDAMAAEFQGPEPPESAFVVGTLAYAAPEQLRGDPDAPDTRTDVFGLAAILCELLTGLPPYVAKNQRGLIKRAKTADLADALERLDKCGAEPPLIALAMRGLAADPDLRPKDAIEFAEEFTDYVESDLRRAERDLVRFFELTLDLFCIAGADGYFKRINGNFNRVLGYTTDELLSKPFLHFVHPDDYADTYAVMDSLIDGKPLVRFRNRYRDANGNYRWFEWQAKAALNEGGIFAVARDVTEEEERHRPGSGV